MGGGKVRRYVHLGPSELHYCWPICKIVNDNYDKSAKSKKEEKKKEEEVQIIIMSMSRRKILFVSLLNV